MGGHSGAHSVRNHLRRWPGGKLLGCRRCQVQSSDVKCYEFVDLVNPVG